MIVNNKVENKIYRKNGSMYINKMQERFFVRILSGQHNENNASKKHSINTKIYHALNCYYTAFILRKISSQKTKQKTEKILNLLKILPNTNFT